MQKCIGLFCAWLCSKFVGPNSLSCLIGIHRFLLIYPLCNSSYHVSINKKAHYCSFSLD